MADEKLERYRYLELKRKRDQGSFDSPYVSGEPSLSPDVPGNTKYAEDVLPTLGAIGMGAAVGSSLGPFGTIGGAAVGGFTGQGATNLIRGARGHPVPETISSSLEESGMEGLKQGGAALLGESVGPFLKGVGKLTGMGSGVVTGASGAVTRAAEAGVAGGKAQAALIKTMRGSVSEKSVANDALESLQTIKRIRAKEYVKGMEETLGKSFQNKIDLTPIKTELDDLLNSYHIGRNADGTMDFSRAALDDPAIADVKRIAEIVDDWGNKPGDNTIRLLDILKRKVDDFWSPSSEARAFVTGLRNKIKETIINKVQKYEEVTKRYHDASELIDDVSSELSLGSNAKAGTIVRKLKQALRQNFDLRKEFVDTLDKAGKRNIMDKIAGIELNPIAPKGLSRAVAAGTAVGAPFVNPAALLSLPFYSPRIAGETALKIGQASRFLSPLKPAVTSMVQAEIGRRRLGLPFYPDEE